MNLFISINKSKVLIEVYEDLSKLPALNDLNACKRTLIIFDDMVLNIKTHPIINEYYIRGRNLGQVLCSYRKVITAVLKS
jgi:hypothetical protein